jgi:hypothetical protein
MITEPRNTKIARLELAPRDMPHLVLDHLRSLGAPVRSVRTVGPLCYATLNDGLSRLERRSARSVIAAVLRPGTYTETPKPSLQDQLADALNRLAALEARP